ncbi:MAG: hypothetical protein WD768_13760 [Phycisphaeraceae bacterium]
MNAATPPGWLGLKAPRKPRPFVDRMCHRAWSTVCQAGASADSSPSHLPALGTMSNGFGSVIELDPLN